MKNLLKISMMAIIALFVSSPLMAAVDIGGSIFLDSYYYHQDKEGFARPGYPALKTTPGSGGIAGIPEGVTTEAEDRNQTYFDLNHATHLRFHWTNEEGLGARTVIYMNGDPKQQSSSDAGFEVGVSIAYLYYDINKNLRLAAGKGNSTEVFSPFNPTRYMGYDGIAKVTGLGYGNVNSKYENNIRLTYKLNKTASLDFALVDPRMVSDTDAGFTPKPGTAIDNVTKIPKLELGVPLKFENKDKNFKATVTPSFFWLKSEFNNVEKGGEDSITSYGASLGASVKIGKLSIAGEYNHGQNLWDAARSGIATCYPFKYEYITGGLRSIMGAKYSPIDQEVYDSETNAFWVQLGYRIGIITPTLFYGQNSSERDMPATPDFSQGDSEFTTKFYGINAPIMITRNMQVVPEFMVWDNGDSNKINNIEYDFGKEWMAGIQLRLFF